MGGTTTPSSVRRELNQKFDALPSFKRDRATALYHLCAALEMSTNPYTVDPDLVMAMGRRVLAYWKQVCARSPQSIASAR
jgi:hypothetical protein